MPSRQKIIEQQKSVVQVCNTNLTTNLANHLAGTPIRDSIAPATPTPYPATPATPNPYPATPATTSAPTTPASAIPVPAILAPTTPAPATQPPTIATDVVMELLGTDVVTKTPMAGALLATGPLVEKTNQPCASLLASSLQGPGLAIILTSPLKPRSHGSHVLLRRPGLGLSGSRCPQEQALSKELELWAALRPSQ